MKKVFLTMAIALGALSFSYAQTPENAAPAPSKAAIMVDKEVHDYGDIPYAGDGTCEFKVTNTGTDPLIMSKCKGSCGCTVPKCDPSPILPGESSIITVKYDTKRPGPINKSVTINSNASNEPVKVVRIKGNVGPDPNAAPSGAPEKAPAGAPAGGN
jgi:archaellum component FlaG (FlaF/FlaG flagellin family)